MSFKEALIRWADDIMYMFGEPRKIIRSEPILRDEWFSDRMKVTTENAKKRIKDESIKNSKFLIPIILKKIETAANNGSYNIIINYTGCDPDFIKERLEKDFRLSCQIFLGEIWDNKRLIIDWSPVKEAVLEDDKPVKKNKKKKKISLREL